MKQDNPNRKPRRLVLIALAGMLALGASLGATAAVAGEENDPCAALGPAPADPIGHGEEVSMDSIDHSQLGAGPPADAIDVFCD